MITLHHIFTELLDECGVSPAHFAAQGGHLDCLQVWTTCVSNPYNKLVLSDLVLGIMHYCKLSLCRFSALPVSAV